MPQPPDVGKKDLAQRTEASAEKPAPPSAVSEQDLLQREDMAREIIAYLSKEIETTTNGMMVFRSKISFAVLVGPFLILGTVVYAAKGLPISIHLGALGWSAIVLVCHVTWR